MRVQEQCRAHVRCGDPQARKRLGVLLLCCVATCLVSNANYIVEALQHASDSLCCVVSYFWYYFAAVCACVKSVRVSPSVDGALELLSGAFRSSVVRNIDRDTSPTLSTGASAVPAPACAGAQVRGRERDDATEPTRRIPLLPGSEEQGPGQLLLLVCSSFFSVS